MAWVKLDDQFFRNPKIVAAGRDARDLYMASLCYSASALTDGVIAPSVLRILGAEADIDNAKSAAGRLVECGLWDIHEKGFRIHDYHDYNPTAEKVLAERSAAQERMRRARSGEVQANNNGTSPNPVPVPRPVPTPVVVPTDEGKPPTVETPKASKPKSSTKLAAEQLYERRMPIFEAFLRGLDIDPHSLAATQRKGPSLQVLTTAILDSPECVPDVIEPLTRYAVSAFQWRHGRTTPSLAEVLSALPEWEAAGRPRAAPPPHGRSQQLPDYLQKRVDVHLQECAASRRDPDPLPPQLAKDIEAWKASRRLGAA